MPQEQIGVDYSELHRLDSPANRLIRESIWAPEDDIGQQSFTTLAYMDEVIHRLGITGDTHLLDVGSGTGGPAAYIAARTGCRITGVEINEVGVEVAASLVAKAGVADRVDFHRGDALSMPFADGGFDMALSLNVMNVFEDKVALFREVRRVLRPGGRWMFLSGTFDLDEGDADIRRRLARGYLIPQFYDSLDGYKAKLQKAGFRVDEVLEYISDFRTQVGRWGAAYRTHRDAIAVEQGEENTASHIDYFDAYLSMIDAGRASNHLILSTAPA
ncbi:MAG: methyltransferase domain-containing protein [Thermoleophilia bacterium]|nr:methyltransferase domain-containing protein [Thermoleophilia bacterium]